MKQLSPSAREVTARATRSKPVKQAAKNKPKRLKKFIRRLVLLGFAGAALALAINFFVIAAGRRHVVTAQQAAAVDADCILVLGAGVIGADNAPSQMLADRLAQGVELYELGASDRLLMSGDHGREDYDEVNTMKQYAVSRGIDSAHVFMDHAGFSTYESLYRAKEIFGVKKIVIVTQRYHLFRALYIAERLGLEACGVASDPRAYGGQEYRAAREVLARDKDFFYTIFKPEPKYLGETIPISGSGDLTNDKD